MQAGFGVCYGEGHAHNHAAHVPAHGGTLSAVRAHCNYLGVWPYWRPMF